MHASPTGPGAEDDGRFARLDPALVHRVQPDRHRLGERGVPRVEAVRDRRREHRRQQHVLGVAAAVGVRVRADRLDRRRGSVRSVTITGSDTTASPGFTPRLRVRADLDDLGRELVAHDQVLAEVEPPPMPTLAAGHLLAELDHLLRVLQEVQVAPADAARERLDEDLSLAGDRVGDVVHDEVVRPPHDGCTHRLSPLEWMALRNSSRGGPCTGSGSRSSRFS